MSDADVLKKQFTSFFKGVADCKMSPDAGHYQVDGINRIVTGIPYPFFNSVMGVTDKVQDQLDYFDSIKMPFMWGLDYETNPKLFQELVNKGFTHCGVMQGVMGNLDKPFPVPSLPKEFSIVKVKSEKDLTDFSNLVGEIFVLSGYSLECFQKAVKHFGDSGKMIHFLIRNEDKPVAAVSIYIEGDLATFWNGATLPEYRRQGLSTAIRTIALNEAISRGCKKGGSYLMAGGMALGICKKFGYDTKWRFDYFVSPQKAS